MRNFSASAENYGKRKKRMKKYILALDEGETSDR